MKTNINVTINKLISYAKDELLLDVLDETYTRNRIAQLCGTTPDAGDADYGDSDLKSLLGELKAAAPTVDIKAVLDVLLPLPHTVNYYFNDQLDRNPQKAFDFLFDLYSLCGCVSSSAEFTHNGFVFSAAETTDARPIMLAVGSDELKYTPLAVADRVAALECLDVFSEDLALREAAFVETYGGVIAKRVGCDCDYRCCKSAAMTNAKVKKSIDGGVAKIALLDYPVPAISVTGPKNSAVREAARIIKHARDEGLACVLAASASDFVTFYVIFAEKIEETDIIKQGGALQSCGVFTSMDFSPLLPVLEKGTALSTDLFEFKSIYSDVGGVKLGAKAKDKLAEAVVKKYTAALTAAASCDETKACELASEK